MLFLNGCGKQIGVWDVLQWNKSTQSFVKLGQMVRSSKGGGEWKKALTHARTKTVTLKSYFLPFKDRSVHA
jgi:hypothetical protein